MGAGIAGLSSAITLSNAGKETLVYEQNDFVGSRFIDCVQAIRNYESSADEITKLREKGLSLKNFRPIFKIYKYSPSLKFNQIYSDKSPLFYSLKRGSSPESIDHQLLKNAKEKGVRVVFNKKVSFKEANVIACGPLFYNGAGYSVHFNDVELEEEAIHFFLDNEYAPKDIFAFFLMEVKKLRYC